MTATFVTIGLTHSDRRTGYSSFVDGYRPSARQDFIRIPVPASLLDGFSIEEIAEAVFEATNSPFEVSGFAGFVRGRLTNYVAQYGPIRSLSVGDTVSADVTASGPAKVAVDRVGFITL